MVCWLKPAPGEQTSYRGWTTVNNWGKGLGGRGAWVQVILWSGSSNLPLGNRLLIKAGLQ